MPTLNINIPSKANICSQTVECLNRLLKEGISGWTLTTTFLTGCSAIARGRTTMANKFYSEHKKGDVMFFLDSDHTFTITDIERGLSLTNDGQISLGAYNSSERKLTCVPLDNNLVEKNQGLLKYGATGMMMIPWVVLDKISKTIEKVQLKKNEWFFPFFYELITEEKEWLGEDYSFCHLCRENDVKIMGWISDTVGHILSDTVYIQAQNKENLFFRRKTDPYKEIVLLSTLNEEKWSPKSLERGIGGSERAMIECAKRWQKWGWNVKIYNNCGDEAGIYDGVQYLQASKYDYSRKPTNLILWRTPHGQTQGKKTFREMQDVPLITMSKLTLSKTDVIVVRSKFHKNMFSEDEQKKIVIFPNGGGEQRAIEGIERVKNSFIWSSCYQRGLEALLDLWPEIKRRAPDATLDICYGWNGFDRLHSENPEAQEWKSKMETKMSQEGITHHGRIGTEDVQMLKSKCQFHYYVSNFPETDCVAVRESASMNCIPIVSCDLFQEKHYVFYLPWLDGKEVHQHALNRIFTDGEEVWKRRAEMYRLEASKDTWTKSAREWEKMFLVE